MIEESEEVKLVRARSVYEALVQAAELGGKVHRSGRMADLAVFDLTRKTVTLGQLTIVHNGKVIADKLQSNTWEINLRNLPWLTEEERNLDPVVLHGVHYISRPNGVELFMHSNFPAKPIDDLTDEEMLKGVPRGLARVQLEAWILCAAMDGTLEKYVTSQPNWNDDNWWWSPPCNNEEDIRLVIKTDWWKSAKSYNWVLSRIGKGAPTVVSAGSRTICHTTADATVEECRTIAAADELRKLVESLSAALIRLQIKAKDENASLLCSEADSVISYIRTGRHNTTER